MKFDETYAQFMLVKSLQLQKSRHTRLDCSIVTRLVDARQTQIVANAHTEQCKSNSTEGSIDMQSCCSYEQYH